VVLDGTETVVVADPDVHETVAGRPVTAVLADEKVQLDALDTVAERVTDPPVQGTGDGLTVKPEIDGPVAASAEPGTKDPPSTRTPLTMSTARRRRPTTTRL
jgi:hypothetical protein